jgi:threonine aldolase
VATLQRLISNKRTSLMRNDPTFKYDFRSDTVTRPSIGMLQAMADADVGDDVYGDDPTVNRLEAIMAERLCKEKALFLSSGTQSNLAGIMAHCGRGDEYIVGQMQHTYRWEAGGAAVLGSVQPQPVINQPDGTLALENTIGGQVIPMSYIHNATQLARDNGLGCHLDGARAFNASVALGIPISELAAPFDSVSICLSKGLGAPVGSVLVGNADIIDKARRIRKMLGGGMRQAGFLAAAGLYALEHNVERLAEDHTNAKILADGLSQFPGISTTNPDTNIVFVELDDSVLKGFDDHLAAGGVAVNGRYNSLRWVTHMDVDAQTVAGAIAHVRTYFN